MINLRYHIVSITAVFLALAIGIAIGTTVINKATVSTLKSRLDGLATRIDDTDAKNDQLQHDLDRLESTLGKLGEQGSAQLLGGHLEGVPVMLVVTRGVDDDSLEGTRQALVDAGAAYGGTLWLTDRLVLDDSNEIEDLATVLGLTSSDADRLRRSLASRLANALLSASLDGEAAPDTTTPSDGEPTTPPETVVGEEPAILRDLRGAGFVDFDSAPDAPDNRVVLAPGVRFVAVSGPGAGVPDDSLLLPMLVDMAAAGPAPVVAAQAGVDVDGQTADETRTVFVGPIRADDALKDRISTVDDLESFAGWAGVVLALQDLASGQFGHYGVGDGADRLLPAPLGDGG